MSAFRCGRSKSGADYHNKSPSRLYCDTCRYPPKNRLREKPHNPRSPLNPDLSLPLKLTDSLDLLRYQYLPLPLILSHRLPT